MVVSFHWLEAAMLCGHAAARVVEIAFFTSLGGLRPSPLGTSATGGPTVPAQGDGLVWTIRWNENCKGKPKSDLT
jgi:hypothetical protein